MQTGGGRVPGVPQIEHLVRAPLVCTISLCGDPKLPRYCKYVSQKARKRRYSGIVVIPRGECLNAGMSWYYYHMYSTVARVRRKGTNMEGSTVVGRREQQKQRHKDRRHGLMQG